MNYFITGIGTDIGKTVIAAMLTEALEADYWKPIQSGDLNCSDTQKVQQLISNTKTVFHPETYRITQPMTPHAAAKIDHTEINVSNIQLPPTNNHLIIEGAGGLMVPLNDQHMIIDLIEQLNAEVILISQNYLGSINHTMLSIEALKSRKLKIAGIIFNGIENKETEAFILNASGLACLGRVQQHETIDKNVILQYKNKFQLHAT